ncbi:MAG TPA: XTP/dITP diphosphatase [Pseudomonadales bacterium]|nr:XTP/dITP diphosphatase [Pseudomonadales bacterium]
MLPKKIVLATGNAGKLAEFQHLFAPLDIEVISQKSLSIPDADETGLSFIENAILKARHAAKLSGLPAIADDSGLEVDALNGEPGIYSARYSGAEATDQRNNAKLILRLAAVNAQQRSGRFHCVLAFMRHADDPIPYISHASWEGEILTEARGSNGFGYDPLFFIPSLGRTAAELSKEEKNKLSHRAQAMQKLLAHFSQPV